MSKPMAEEVAEKSIRQAGYRVYLPRSSKQINGTYRDERGHKHRRRGEIVMRPAFRGYLFVELWAGQPWRGLMDTRIERGGARGVADMILSRRGTDAEYPYMLPPALIEAIREAENRGDLDEPKGLRCRGQSRKRMDIVAGNVVRINSGPFATFLATITDLDDQGRAFALIDIMGRDTPIEFDETDTAALEVVSS